MPHWPAVWALALGTYSAGATAVRHTERGRDEV